MKIAVISPCPVPYTIGGAEKLWWGLKNHLNEHTPHQADIIKLPTLETDFWSLIDGYRQFSRLRLDGFDLVISGKYPAWMVEHPRHVCYMLHRSRGLYDAYSGPPLAKRSSYPLVIQELLELLDRNAERREVLPELFERLAAIADEEGELKAFFSYPGPLSRAVVHFLDNLALSPKHIIRFASIAHTVVQRPDYFPEGVEIAVAYPPSSLYVTPGHDFRYFFTVSRLDSPKRIDLLIEAMRHVKADIELLIAGEGPDEERLKALAKDDRRIKFLGFKSDTELAKLYQDALAVPFIPYQEDYGLITVEGMMAAKPIITVKDAGGPTELVRHGENGLLVDATPQALGQALIELVDNPQLAKSLGLQGRKDAEKISWDTVTDTLLPPILTVKPSSITHRATRQSNGKKLVVAVTFPIYPPRHGGQNRIFNFYRHLATEFDVTIIALTDPAIIKADIEIAPGLREIRIPKTHEQIKQEKKLQGKFSVPITDITAALYYRYTPALLDTIHKEAADATVLIASHPYLYSALAEVSDKPIWYEAHNVEFQLKSQLLSSQAAGAELVDKVKNLEKSCCMASQIILACSEDDASTLSSEFKIPKHKIIIAPNGTNCSEIHYFDSSSKNKLKQRLGCDKQQFILFMGSGHHPNITAVQEMFKIAHQLPKINFLIIGNVCYAFDPTQKPENVWLLGEVTEITRKIILELADVALNPMLSGSGTNLKMLDYFAAGVPVIATDIGARGLNVLDNEHLLICPTVNMASAIKKLLAQPEHAAHLSKSARRHVEENFDWGAITNRVLAHISNLFVSTNHTNERPRQSQGFT